ncbi:hypothetical protein BX600DRAFT_475408 [Xylariales sp. PMI_506]|nr:hypothetical protein BX600DRAFT_475408 [Xylariales sp. PMI_506]
MCIQYPTIGIGFCASLPPPFRVEIIRNVPRLKISFFLSVLGPNSIACLVRSFVCFRTATGRHRMWVQLIQDCFSDPEQETQTGGCQSISVASGWESDLSLPSSLPFSSQPTTRDGAAIRGGPIGGYAHARTHHGSIPGVRPFLEILDLNTTAVTEAVNPLFPEDNVSPACQLGCRRKCFRIAFQERQDIAERKSGPSSFYMLPRYGDGESTSTLIVFACASNSCSRQSPFGTLQSHRLCGANWLPGHNFCPTSAESLPLSILRLKNRT